MPRICPRLPVSCWMTVEVYAVGTIDASRATIGSSTTGLHFGSASRTPMPAAVLNDCSLESTSWY